MDPKEFELVGKKVLMGLGRALTDVSLYKKGHPTPAQSLRDLFAALELILVDAGSFSLFRDRGQFIANGVPVLKVEEAPATLKSFFERYRLHSLTFVGGLEFKELELFFDLAEAKELAKDFSLAEFLEGKKAQHFKANVAAYQLVEGEVEQVTAVPKPAEELDLAKELESLNLEDAIMALVKRAVKDPAIQAKVYEWVMSQIKKELERRVNEATQALKLEAQRLENERVRTESVIGEMAAGSVTIDPQGRVLMMDGPAEDLAGRKLAEMAGKPLADAVRKEEQVVSLSKELDLPVADKAKGEVEVVGEEKLSQALRASNLILRDQKGRTVGLLMSLPEAAKFREVERMQQEFVASITHELRAPLTSIISALSILEGQLAQTLSKDQNRVLGLATKNANRLVDLVAEILDFQRIQSGHMSVHCSTSQVDEMVKESTDALKPWAVTRGIDLNWEVAPGLPPVMADHRRTVQVVTNLVSNAIKFTPAGGKIWVKAAKGKGDQVGFVVCSVKDTGKGIAKEDQDRIFDKFVQIASGARRSVGAGLGLAIAKYLVYAQKGKMWVESELGKGAAFLFTLPMDIPPMSTTPTPAQGPAKAATPPPAPPPRKSWLRRLFGG